MRRLLLVLAVLALIPIILVRAARPDRTAVSRDLYPGVTYTRHVTDDPAVVAHVVEVDLTQPGVGFLVTPPDENGRFAPLTTAQFLRQTDVQLAINGSFYQETGREDALLPLGLTISEGQPWTNGRFGYPTLCVSESNAIQIDPTGLCTPDTVQALAGNVLLLNRGVPLDSRENRFPGRGNAFRPQPRTAVALNETGTTLWLVVIDGRQGSYSEGMTLDALGEFLQELGAYTALNLDGGGSSTLVKQRWTGPYVLNSPIDIGIPSRQRPVATHFGVYLNQPAPTMSTN